MTQPIAGVLDTHYWQTIFDLIPFPIYVVDVESMELIAANREMRRRTSVIEGVPCHKAIYQSEGRCNFCSIAALKAKGELGREVVFEHFNEADDRWYQLQESLISWFDGRTAKYSIGVDISTLKEAQNKLAEAHVKISLQNQELETLSLTDRLTGLSNRRKLDHAFAQEMDRAARYGESLSVVLTDVDKFKAVNDSFGHQVGDSVLVDVAVALRCGIRTSDILGRWGGEEFMVICPNTPLDGAQALAENLRLAVRAKEMNVVGTKTCSFGVAQWDWKESPEALVARADAALYRAKANGRDRVELDTTVLR